MTDQALADAIANLAATRDRASLWQAWGVCEAIAVNARLNGRFELANDIAARMNAASLIPRFWSRFNDDQANPWSIINYHPEGHPARVGYEQRIADEAASLGIALPEIIRTKAAA